MTNFKIQLSVILCLLSLSAMAQLKPTPIVKPKQLDIRYLKVLPTFTAQSHDTVSTFSTTASGSRRYATGHAFAEIEGKGSSHVTQLDYKDTLIGNEIKHYTTIVARISAVRFLDELFKKLGDRFHPAESYSMVASLTTFNYETIEERRYEETETSEISLPSFNTSEKTPVEFKIKVESKDVRTDDGGDSRRGTIGPRAKVALRSNFKLRVGNLPSTRIFAISAITIQKVYGGLRAGDSTAISDFTIDLAQVDAAGWNEWFQSPQRNTDLKPTELILLGPDRRQELLTINLGEVEIISYSSIPVSENPSGAKRIGLRARSVSMQLNIE